MQAITHNELKAQLYNKSLVLSDPRLLGCLTVAQQQIEAFRGICYFLWNLNILTDEELNRYIDMYCEERVKISEELRKTR